MSEQKEVWMGMYIKLKQIKQYTIHISVCQGELHAKVSHLEPHLMYFSFFSFYTAGDII